MISSIAHFVALISIFAMFKVKREYKMGILFLSYMCYGMVTFNFLPFLNGAGSLISLAFLLSEYKNIQKCIRQLKKSVIWKFLGCIAFLFLLTFANSPHLRTIPDILRFFLSELLIKYFVIAYSFYSFRQSKSIIPTLRLSYIGIIVLTIIGVINYVTKTADYVAAMMRSQGVTNDFDKLNGTVYMFSDRFRVQSMFGNPFDYGYICVMCLIIHLFGYEKRYESKYTFVSVVICCSFGILTCGSRTVLLCALICICTYLLTAYKAKKTLRISIFAVFVGTFSYLFVPIVGEKMDSMLTMFDKNSQVQGSSIELRANQFTAVFRHIEDAPILGKGYAFFREDMGWSKEAKFRVDTDLAGLESIVMNLLLERGVVGLIIWIVAYGWLIKFLMRNRIVHRKSSALGLAVLAAYLSYSTMTGELGSASSTLFLLGFAIKTIEIDDINARICNSTH